MDRCPFTNISVNVENTDAVTSDYVALGFLTGEFGPQPYPRKSLVKYQRLFNITAGQTQTATLALTLGSLGRVDANGNTVLYPGSYSLQIDTQPLTAINFTLTGTQATLDLWPQPPSPSNQQGDYFVGGFGSNIEEVLACTGTADTGSAATGSAGSGSAAGSGSGSGSAAVSAAGAASGSVISQISDGQVQAPTAAAVSQISDGQIQASRAGDAKRRRV